MTISLMTKIEACARAAHETNRSLCIALGDMSQPHWEDAPDWQKESAMNGIWGALNGATPEQSHESWSKEKIATGWVWGKVKDTVLKTHPCLVTYHSLPESQRAKDDVYLSVVDAMADALTCASRES